MYTYHCEPCNIRTVKIISMEARDAQICDGCGNPFERKIDRPGLVYAPTAGGMR